MRSSRPKRLATDGGLELGQGTYGLIISDTKERTLVTGAGPADGLPRQSSSNHSELYLLAAPLKLLEQVHRYYSIPACDNFVWIHDSENGIA